MHYPVGPGSVGGLSSVEDQRLLEPDHLVELGRHDRPVLARRLPVPASGRPVRPAPVRVFGLSHREEVPLVFAPT